MKDFDDIKMHGATVKKRNWMGKYFSGTESKLLMY